MTRCPQCSGENADTQRFCGECGTPLPVDLKRKVALPGAEETLPLPSIDLDTGTLFARRYQMVEELGVGGMGRVYRVLDKKLNEEIALKVVRPDIASDKAVIARFSSELKLARQIVHRNVARMFDLNEEHGVPYITMEYVKGENLKRLIRKVGCLSPGQAVPIACQICDGLAEAHRLGIVHRDLKPQNIMIDEEGQAKIMDFGLARLLAQDGRDGLGARSGSPAYVSPERIKGDPADARSDLYSLGILIYEMLTGHTPFKAETIEELLDMHLHETPRDPRELNPAVQAELSAMVMKCLEKDPGRRYQSAGELREALGCLAKDVTIPPASSVRRWLLIAGAAVALAAVAIGARALLREKPWENSLAVLPVEGTVAGGESQSLFADLQNEITDRLIGVPGLRVVPRISVNSYDTKGKSSPEIGKLLRVRYLLTVKVDVRSNGVDAKIGVIDAKKDSVLQPMTYSKETPDYRVLQDEIAMYTARMLGTAIGEEQLDKFRRRGTDNIEAYNLYLDGMSLIERQKNDADIREAIDKYLRAIRIDPRYALAYWGAGNAYENLYYAQKDEEKDPAALEKMYWYFSRASDLDPTFAETNLGLGWYYFNKGDNPRAYEFFKKALELEPQKYLVNRDAGAFLRSIGLYEQGIRCLNKAVELSPRDSQPVVQLAQSWLFLGRSEKALQYAKRAVALDPGNQDAGVMRALLLMVTESLDEADFQLDALEKIGYPVERLGRLRKLTAKLRGDRTGTTPFTDEKPSLAPHGTYVYLLLGMKDEAIANIQAGIDAGFWNGMYLYSYPSLVKNPWYKELRHDPRFRAILKRQKEIYLRELKPLEKF